MSELAEDTRSYRETEYKKKVETNVHETNSQLVDAIDALDRKVKELYERLAHVMRVGGDDFAMPSQLRQPGDSPAQDFSWARIEQVGAIQVRVESMISRLDI